jgi:hypothetical protein
MVRARPALPRTSACEVVPALIKRNRKRLEI